MRKIDLVLHTKTFLGMHDKPIKISPALDTKDVEHAKRILRLVRDGKLESCTFQKTAVTRVEFL
jgi:hypothetical protein